MCVLEAFYTDLQWYPLASKRQQGGNTDAFAVSCTDGKSQHARWLQFCQALWAVLMRQHTYRVIQDHIPVSKAGKERGGSQGSSVVIKVEL